MSHPSDDELVDLALGEPAAADVSAHVAECVTCSSAVSDLRRTMRLVSDPGPYAAWQSPDDAVWSRVAAQLDTVEEEAPAHDAAPGPPPHTRVVAAAPESSDAAPTAPVTRLERPARRRTAAWAAGLVAASLVVGLLTGRAIWGSTGGGQVAQVALATLDTRQAEGEATLVRAATGLDLEVTTNRPLDAGDGYLEVWLINADGKRMVSVGVLRPGEPGSFPVTQALIDQGYVVVDISKEQFDDKPAHSGDSLLRGQLPA
ncbi:MAG: anti-sigma factor [Terrabacter sp.]